MRNTLLIVFGIILLVALLAGAFYWYQFRPSEIRKICAKQAHDKVNALVDSQGFKSVAEASKFYDTSYTICIQEHGLK